MYERGEGVERNIEAAVHVLKKLCCASYARTCYHLGMLYYYGKEVPQDRKLAYEYFSRCSDRNKKCSDALRELFNEHNKIWLYNPKHHISELFENDPE